MRPRTQKVLKRAEYVAMTALLVLAAYVGANYALGFQTVYVVTDNPSSMSPTINYGDVFF